MSRKTCKKQMVSPLSAARRYASEGLHVVPLHGLKDGRCTCGNADCCQPGMHPRTKNGVADATTDLAQIEKRWTKWSKAKIGIVFGGPGKLLGLMTDGEAGQRKLREIIRTNGELPRTVTIWMVIERPVSLDMTETIPPKVTSPITFESLARVILLLHHQASII